MTPDFHSYMFRARLTVLGVDVWCHLDKCPRPLLTSHQTGQLWLQQQRQGIGFQKPCALL